MQLTTKQELIDQMQQEHEQWEAILAEIGRERMELPGVTGEWTMKDTIAHLTTWWRRRVAELEAARRGERPEAHPPQSHVPIINQWVYLTNRDRPLEYILRDAEETWRQFTETLEAIPEEILFDPARFDWLEGKALGPAVVEGFPRHFRIEHEASIRATGWRSKSDVLYSLSVDLEDGREPIAIFKISTSRYSAGLTLAGNSSAPA